MPEASMDKKNRMKPWKNKVWFAWQLVVVKPISQSMSVQERTHLHFGLRVLLLYSRHHSASLFFADVIQSSFSIDVRFRIAHRKRLFQMAQIGRRHLLVSGEQRQNDFY